MKSLFITIFLLSSSLALSQSLDFEVAGVTAKVEKINLTVANNQEALKDLKRAEGDFGYQVNFGNISRQEFNALVDYYQKEEHLTYRQNQQYQLVDFLPAKMQALLNKRLENTVRYSEELANIDLFYKNSGEIYSSINCWGTAWEMTRDASAKTPFYAFMSPRRYTQKLLQSEELGELVQPGHEGFGDMLIFLAGEAPHLTMQHAAVHVGSGFYFERTDSGSYMFFRLVHFSDMDERIKLAFKDWGDLITIDSEFRRFGGENKISFPNPIDAFSAEAAAGTAMEEYLLALPGNENSKEVTFFVDDRFGGGDEVTLQDTASFSIVLNPITGRGEIAKDPGYERFVDSD